MGIFREIPPSAGFKIHGQDFFSTKPGTIEEDFRKFLGVQYARTISSGTAGLYAIMEVLKTSRPQRVVVIPSFVCPAVVYGIARAGLQIQVCDLQPDSFDFDYSALEKLCAGGDVLAVLAVHLGGLAQNMAEVQRITKARNIYLVEDVAQSLGAEYKSRKAGSFGDFSFFSMGAGKGFTIYEGGMIATNNKELFCALESKLPQILQKQVFASLLDDVRIFAYWLVYRPALFWFVFKLPRRFWQLLGNEDKAMVESNRIDFPLHEISKLRRKFAHNFFRHVEPELAKQREKAKYYLQNLRAVSDIRTITALEESRGTYPFLTLIFPSQPQRDRAWKMLDRHGLGPYIVYSRAIDEYPDLKKYLSGGTTKNAQLLARNSLTLSTSSYLKPAELEKIVSLLNDVCRR